MAIKMQGGETDCGFRHHLYSGLSGLQLPTPKYLFPPPFKNSSRLTYYASIFNSIEINSSFYKVPRPATVANWAASVPEHFRFTFKLWKEITHKKSLNFNNEDVITFFNAINSVHTKKGCLLIQFPPGIGREYSTQLENLLGCINNSDPKQEWKLAVEFRNKSWYHEDVYDVLNFHKTAIVIQDIPKSATPLLNHKSDFIYLRFHGPTGNYRESYSEDFLREYGNLINEWIEEGKSVYTYFNNTIGDAFNNVKLLNHFVQHQ
ncbi:DUF72 domain-containing protein [Salegentibacter sp. F188]|uniref:DUF72 domain-containing protein n=1 Tax=Autumnicola patrickiae TaxID=3075591 RepID=A0ABU3E585_9FLAO|nr:DUF72 domain-containing protein [Salegentibacter sp. F188]MDT0691134.1 DUF72 domain-containing protein [Salegentibacter sp. F188]